MTIQDLIRVDSAITATDAKKIEASIAKLWVPLMKQAHNSECGVVPYLRAVLRVMHHDIENF